MNQSVIALLLVCAGGFGAAYSYFIYPLILLLVRDSARVDVSRAAPPLHLTMVIAARNEERRIREKIDETLALRAADPRLQILVASDASTDATDRVVAEFRDRGVALVRTEVHNGKEFAQQEAIRAATGEVVVFTDTGTTIAPDSIARIVTLFADPTVGAVSSTDKFIDNEGRVSGEGLYIRYEMWLRDLESRKCGLIGLSGSFFAARREVCGHWDTTIPSDFATALTCRMLGLRAISDTHVIGLYRDVRDPQHEFARKVRTIIRGMSAVARKRQLLNPLRHGLLSLQLWSHKVLRWSVPWFVLIYVAGALLWRGVWPATLLLAPVAALAGVSVAGAAVPVLRRNAAVNAAYYFVQANMAVLYAGLLFLAGKRVTTWVPTKR